MTRGVPKELATKAQEQYDKQRRLIERMKAKRNKLMQEVMEINDKLVEEERLYTYYSQHPLVKDEHRSEPELPLVYGQSEAMQDDIGEALARQDRVEVSK